jgi:Family of unknown function (DUF6188)
MNHIVISHEIANKMKKRPKVTKQNTGWLWSIEGFSVIRCIIDHAISFEIADEDYRISLQIEGEFLYKRLDSMQAISLDNPKTIANVLSIINVSTSRIWISNTGDLNLELVTGEELLLRAHEIYEAWQIITTDDIRIVCMPSGQLAFWGLDIDKSK